MNLSYWEIKTWLHDVDFTIIGSGIVGLNCALALREKHPKSTILVLEKGVLPQGASTKNAGFACFGSISELVEDLKHHEEDTVLSLIEKRWKGLMALRKLLGDKAIDYRAYGGYEIFRKEDISLYDSCIDKMTYFNKLLQPLFKSPVFSLKPNNYNFAHIQQHCIFNTYEGQLDTGRMMHTLLKKCQESDIKILNATDVISFEDLNHKVQVKTSRFELQSKHLFIATNGFASNLIDEKVQPARAQVLITEPIPKLHIKGTFHFTHGYYYFRNIANRILFGGGRDLDKKGETTTAFNETPLIQNELERLLKTIILPDIPFKIEHRWSGIMGVSSTKTPILKAVSNRVYCGIRLGGMGVAIGTLIGRELACFADS